MKRTVSPWVAIIAMLFVAIPDVRASDISCETSPRSAPTQCAGPVNSGTACANQKTAPMQVERMICDHALLAMGHERIYAAQQRLLRSGSISEADIVAWRKKRDSCESVSCLDKLFAEWQQQAAKLKAAGRKQH